MESVKPLRFHSSAVALDIAAPVVGPMSWLRVDLDWTAGGDEDQVALRLQSQLMVALPPPHDAVALELAPRDRDRDGEAVGVEMSVVRRREPLRAVTAAERETAYAPFAPPIVTPSRFSNGSSALDNQDDRNSEESALLLESRRQQFILLDNEIVFNEAIIEEREQGIQEIQHQIGEVTEIFKDLAVLGHEQGTMIEDIDSNIENSYAATAQAKTQLVNAAESQRTNSSLTCLLLVIFGFILLVVVIVLAA